MINMQPQDIQIHDTFNIGSGRYKVVDLNNEQVSFKSEENNPEEVAKVIKIDQFIKMIDLKAIINYQSSFNPIFTKDLKIGGKILKVEFGDEKVRIEGKLIEKEDIEELISYFSTISEYEIGTSKIKFKEDIAFISVEILECLISIEELKELQKYFK